MRCGIRDDSCAARSTAEASEPAGSKPVGAIHLLTACVFGTARALEMNWEHVRAGNRRSAHHPFSQVGGIWLDEKIPTHHRPSCMAPHVVLISHHDRVVVNAKASGDLPE